jgi:predicted metalloendopeptidase
MGKADGIAMERILSGQEDENIAQDELLQKAKDYYQSCLNVDKIMEAGIEPILPLAQEIMDRMNSVPQPSPVEMLGWLSTKAVFAFFRG